MDLVALGLERGAHEIEDIRLVVDHQNRPFGWRDAHEGGIYRGEEAASCRDSPDTGGLSGSVQTSQNSGSMTAEQLGADLGHDRERVAHLRRAAPLTKIA
jgi:hypothetical protein